MTRIVTPESEVRPETRAEVLVDLSQVPDAPDSGAELAAQADAGSLGWFAVVADRAATAVAGGDRAAMSGLLDGMRDVDAGLARAGDARDSVRRHAIRAVIEVLGALHDRLVVEHPAIRPNSEVGIVLITMSYLPSATNARVAEAAGLDPSQVSRTGRRLQALGLAHAIRCGRENAWQLTPRGRQVAERLIALSSDLPTPARLPAGSKGAGQSVRSLALTLGQWLIQRGIPAMEAAAETRAKAAAAKAAAKTEIAELEAARQADQLLAELHRITSEASALAATGRAPAKKAAGRAPAKKAAGRAPAKKTATTKAPAKKTATTKAPAKKTATTKAPAKKTATTKAPAKKTMATKAPAKKTMATKAPAKMQVRARV